VNMFRGERKGERERDEGRICNSTVPISSQSLAVYTPEWAGISESGGQDNKQWDVG
jgi:hypothetical protein